MSRKWGPVVVGNADGKGRTLQLDDDAIARAEAALAGLSGQFDSWLNEEFSRLQAALAETKVNGLTGPSGSALYQCAHDLKGLGATCENPLVTQLAGSLCRLLDDEDKRERAPMSLAQAHVAAIQAAIRHKITNIDEGTGAQLLTELRGNVDAAIDAA